MFGIIYMTVNKVNGKCYIGQHKCNDENDSYLGSGKALLDAIKKYGRENFIRHTLYVAESEKELDEKEIEFISKYNAAHRPDFYNINEGGNANRMCGENNPMYGRKGPDAPNYGHVYTDEEKEAMRQRVLGEKNPMYGHVYTEEERKKIGDGQRGEKHWNYGKQMSEETKRRISESKKGKTSWAKGVPMREETKQKLSLSKKGLKPNLSSDAREQMAERIIERNHTKKFRQQVSNANKRFHEQGGRRGAKPVVCVETNIVYASSYDAARAIGCGKSSISACFSGSCKTVKGYHWRYATEEEAAGKLVYVA